MSPLLRCYLPLTTEQLDTLHRTRSLAPSITAFTAWAPTTVDSSGHEEEDEHAALQSAAHHALDRGGPVIVVAADLEQEMLTDITPSGAGSVVQVHDAVPLPRIASLHVGDDLLGRPAAAVTDDEEIELSWYDTTEVDHLVGLL